MIVARVCMLLFAAIFAVFGPSHVPNNASLQVAGYNSIGERIDRLWVVLTSLDGREVYRENGRDVTISVPQGDYALKVEAPGFEAQRQLVRVYRPKTYRSVMLPTSYIYGQTAPGLSGKIVKYQGNLSLVRVRLISMYGSDVMEALPDKNGAFDFPAHSGSYILMVLADDRGGPTAVDWRTVRIQGQETIAIDLSRRSK